MTFLTPWPESVTSHSEASKSEPCSYQEFFTATQGLPFSFHLILYDKDCTFISDALKVFGFDLGKEIYFDFV